MSMGLAGMAGAAGAGDALATLFDQRLRAAAEQRAQQQQQIQQQEFQQNQARLDALMRITAQEKADTVAQHLKTETDANRTRLNAELTALPQDQTIGAGTHDALIAGGVLPERMNPTPITPEAPPPSLAAPDQPPPGPLPGTIANSPAPAARTFQRIATPKEAAQQKLLALFPVGSKERLAAEYNIGTGGDNLPAGILPKVPTPGPIHDTANGLVRVNEDNTTTPLGVQGYHPPKDTSAGETGRMDRSYAAANSSLEALRKPLADQAERFGRLTDTINQHSPQADALIAPEMLTVMAGGIGSGLRMNEAEIARIVGGRSNVESLKAALNKWSLNPAEALSVTEAQRGQIRDLMTAVGTKSRARLDLLNHASQDLIDAPDVGTHRRVVAQVRKAIDEIGLTPSPTTTTGGGGGDALAELERRRAARGAK